MASGVASCNTGVFGKTLDTIKQAGIRVSRRSPDSVTLQESSGTTDHNGLHRNHENSPWQVLLRKTKSDNFRKSFDLAQCSVEDVDEAATQRLRAEEDSYKVLHRGGAVTSKTSHRNASSPTLEALDSRRMVLVFGDLANTRVPE